MVLIVGLRNIDSVPLDNSDNTYIVTEPAKTGHICTNYTPLENDMFLGH